MQQRFAIRTLSHLLLLTSALLAAELPEIPNVLGQEIGKFRTLMSSPVPGYRVEGAQGARHLRLQSFEPELIVLLGDKHPVVRQEAVLALAECGTWRAVPHLVGLLDDPNWALREHAQLALRRMTGTTVEQPTRAKWHDWWEATGLADKQTRLIETVRSAEAQERRRAAYALRCLATPALEDELLELLREAKRINPKERKLLTEALDRIGKAKSMPYFLERAGVGDGAAAWAVGRRGGEEAEEALMKGVVRNRGLDFLLNLDRVGATGCGPYLSALCRNFVTVISAGYAEDVRYPPSPLRRVSANLIRRSGRGAMLVDLILAEMECQPKEAAIPQDLKPCIQDLRRVLKPEFVREGVSQCAFLLGAMSEVADDRSIVPRLIPLLRSKVLLVRVYAALTLGNLRATEAVAPMLAVIRDGYDFSDATAIASGKHTGEFRMVDAKRVRQSHTVRWLAYLCVALGHIGNEEAREALEILVVDSAAPRDVRYGSVVGLGIIGSSESLAPLGRAAREDIIWQVRDVAKQTTTDIKLASAAARAP